MGNGGQIRGALNELLKNGEELYAKVCEVTVVDEAAKTADVAPVDGSAEIFGVPLQADTQGEGLVVYPKVGSHVLVVFTSKHTAAVCGVSEVDGMSYKDTQGVEWSVKGGKVSVRNGDYSLKQAFYDLIDTIGRLTVTTGVGPSGIPVNKAEFDVVKENVGKILND
jgi:hypothetical protein